ncbi:NADPH dehydrogenase [Lacticaseibacillus pantheris DSM 15945 = JCM 12539 = NBRC 106106]|uniref:NADPH dehydrogenase n=1 Tax=Lacticaseibacillus pantheris DSM 15945 = JCM 12539 = NBRC 106106 TaxID=1423783 RepID=A0A0R1U4G4_9LACO|nr:NAD(P)H-dependent oxidoreductase [Lacticaseibacillus pantheris]KRL87636.1 NADPH dehydrogenase [Lacticaseibacillus pantheris DSM 15945 = JCM 12539 = NBRC 106106]
MRTLIIVSHPDIAASSTQSFLAATAALESDNELVALDELPAAGRHELWDKVVTADRIILQFPLYWYSAPASLWAWLDEEWTDRHVSVGRDATLSGKDLALVVTTGHPDAAFRVGGLEKVSLDELMAPFWALARKAGMVVVPAVYINDFAHQDDQERTQTYIRYRQLLSMRHPGAPEEMAAWFAQRAAALGDELIATELTDRDDDLGQLRGVVGDLRRGSDD